MSSERKISYQFDTSEGVAIGAIFLGAFFSIVWSCLALSLWASLKACLGVPGRECCIGLRHDFTVLTKKVGSTCICVVIENKVRLERSGF